MARKNELEFTLDPKDLLYKELHRRCQNNPSYSMRAFAKSLGFSHSYLLMLLNGKRSFSKNAIEKIVKNLNLTIEQRETLIRESKMEPHLKMNLDLFSIISEWYYYALLSFVELPQFKLDYGWISNCLELPENEIKQAFDKLQELGFIKEDSSGKLLRSIPPITFNNLETSEAGKKYNRQILEKASESMDKDSFDERILESITFKVDSSKISEVRTRLREVCRELANEFEKLGENDSVYCLGIQTIPFVRTKSTGDDQ